MEIKREILGRLKEWKESEDRRPLIIQGARQIGKTWVMKQFGKTYYRHVAYFNFDENEELAEEFETTKQPSRIVARLQLLADHPISPEETLIIFDEIQECPAALNSLKYFCESAPEYHIIAAGSLLGVAIHRHKGFPVGKVDFLRMYPVTFKEYLTTTNPRIAHFIDQLDVLSPLPAIVEGPLWEAYRAYQICGGMPKAVMASLGGKGNQAITKEQDEILTSYFLDFSKHAPTTDIPKIASVWRSLPSQLAKENRKFIYKVVRPGARAREYESAIDWLREAGLIYQVFCSAKPALPLSAYDDVSAFKIYMVDSGLLRRMANLPPEILTMEPDRAPEFRGALTENIVLQSILPQLGHIPRYWVSNGTAEIDFLIQEGLEVLPIEVKAGSNTAGKSLSVYIKKFNPEIVVVFSAQKLRLQKSETEPTILHVPLPLACWLPRLLQLAASEAVRTLEEE